MNIVEPAFIRRLPNKHALFRYLTLYVDVSIRTGDVAWVVATRTTTIYDPSLEMKFEVQQFVREVVREYNATHYDDVTDVEVLEEMNAIWAKEVLAAQREREGMISQ